ncbi:hypothetical protein KKF64_00420 [Patescibacteria group bacterium]|nr:hypothetical protein [Patescibacteria group bacterium]
MFKEKRIESCYYPILIGSSILIVLILWFFAIWRYQVSADFVPLHYTIYFGLDRFGPKFDLFLFPTLGTVILILNLIISRIVLEDSKLWQTIFVGLTFLMQLTLLTSFILSVLKGLS